jgi:hypothetical protein
MAFPLNVAKAVFRWDLTNNTEGINVMHFQRFGTTDFGTAQCQEVAEALHDWYSNANFLTETNFSLKSYLDSNCFLREIVVSDVGAGPSVQYTETVNEAGALTATPLPVESSVVCTWRTLTPGRSGRGRTFFPGFTTGSLDDAGGLASSQVTNVGATCQALVDGLVTEGDYFAAVFSPLNSSASIITSATVQPVIHHQRRRNG